MTPKLVEIWVYLSTSPLLGLTLTLAAYQAAWWIYQRCHSHPLANPVMIAVLMLASALTFTGTSYRAYFDGAQFVHFLLGPATVALAIPLYAQFQRLKTMALPLLLVLVAGSFTAATSAIAIGIWCGASKASVLSLAPKSATTPIAMGIAESLGGLPSLTAVLVIITGIVGAIAAQATFRWLKVDDDAVKGFAMGIASHGIGTARAFQISEQAGAFSALGMGLNGLMTALLVPLVTPWVTRWLS